MVGVVLTSVYPLEDTLLLNEVKPSKVRSGVALAQKSKGTWDQALVLISGAIIHSLKNLNFLSDISYLGQFTNTTGSKPLCEKMRRFCGVL